MANEDLININDEHDNDSHERFQAARKSTWVSVIVNCLLTLVQVITGVFSGSQGLIADGIHSLSDLIADFVVLVANKKARKNQTKTIITDIIDMKMEHH
jgi:divalent metal cation (Fe/Co/Zn/Cd) transporter